MSRWLVVMPTWFGDCVMATPAVRALRAGEGVSSVTALIAPPLAPLIEGLPSIDEIMPRPVRGGVVKLTQTVARLQQEAFDAALLLPNSMRSAVVVAAAGVPRRFGYARDGRGWLLTDTLAPPRDGRAFAPVTTLDYYLALALAAGGVDRGRDMEVAVGEPERHRAAELLADAQGRPVVLLNPGAQKPQKRWPAERFGALATWCRAQLGAAVAVTGSPAERAVLDAVIAAAGDTPVIDLPARGVNVRALKAVTAAAAVMVTNDTGPRHLAAAVGTPIVSLFGPTTFAWTDIGFEHERIVTAAGRDTPAPIDGITLEAVCDAVSGLWSDALNRQDAETPRTPSERHSG